MEGSWEKEGRADSGRRMLAFGGELVWERTAIYSYREERTENIRLISKVYNLNA